MLAEIAKWGVQSYRLRKSPLLPRQIRSEIIKAGLQLAVIAPASPAQCLGFRVSYATKEHFRYLFKEIFLDATYAFQTDNARPTIIDCGSNIGMSILFFKKLYPNSHITAFEPDPSTFNLLKENVFCNRLSDVFLHQVALGDAEGTTKFYRSFDPNASDLTMSTLEGRHAGPAIEVNTSPLSKFIVNTVDLLKIDVEGAEELVLREVCAAGKLSLVDRIHLEYHHHIDRDTDRLSDMLAMLEANGFGYQLRSDSSVWPDERGFQDISIYGYRKGLVRSPTP
jgi:FkbM family methyltransferase